MNIFSAALFIRAKREKKWLIIGECCRKLREINPMDYFVLQMIILNFKDYLAIPGKAYHITSREQNTKVFLCNDYNYIKMHIHMEKNAPGNLENTRLFFLKILELHVISQNIHY